MKNWNLTTVPVVILGGKIVCPTCNGSMLHQVEAKIWFRSEDAEKATFAHVLGDTVLVDRKNYGNPSPRRSGLKIMLRCEWCHTDDMRPSHELAIYQHKGETFTEMRCYIEDKS